MQFRLIFLGLLMAVLSQVSLAEDITGKWKTVDDKTGYSRGDVQISKNADGTYSGKITAIRPMPGKQTKGICTECNGPMKDKPLVNLQIIYNFVQNSKKPNEYIDGKVFDPLSGNTYRGKIKLSEAGNRLTLRGFIEMDPEI
ncbi:DUF2147 domain-containing protein [Acinetobacter sp. XH1639]